jgi:hypothetical protein
LVDANTLNAFFGPSTTYKRCIQEKFLGLTFLSHIKYCIMSEAKVQLLGVLREATSQDYARMRQAEGLLKEWENSPSFFATLQVHWRFVYSMAFDPMCVVLTLPSL